MEDKIITTPNGYKVYIKPFLTYTQFTQMQKLYTKDMKLDPNKKKDEDVKLSEIPASLIFEVQDLTIQLLVRKIEDKEGRVVERSSSELPIPVEDGEVVMAIIKEISDQATTSFNKKKQMISPS